MKSRSILVLIIVSFLATAVANAKYSGGTGEPNDPYRIATAEDLNDIGNHIEDLNKCFILFNDVNLAEYTGTQFKIIGNTTTQFTGVFDGNDHKILNFAWDSNGINYIGLFGFVGFGGQIKDLGLENIDINDANGSSVGGLAGENAGTITNCDSKGSVLGGYFAVGGLVGKNYGTGAITNCNSTGSVSGTDSVGGLVGYGGTITNCHSTSNVLGEGMVGGLVGGKNSGTIINCYSTGSVSGISQIGGLVGMCSFPPGTIANCYSIGSVTGGWNVGGLVGYNEEDMITDCYSTGNVEGGEYDYEVGGLVGYNFVGTIADCYSTGNVIGNISVGGLAGSAGGEIANCYSTGSVTGNSYFGGLVGSESGGVVASFWDVDTSGQTTSGGGTGKTTVEMKTKSTFTGAGWDFIEIWGIEDNQTYPFLKLTYPVGDLDLDKDVDFQDFAHFADHWLEETGT